MDNPQINMERETDRERYDLFALLPDGQEEEGWINLHFLIWKYLIALLTRVELEDARFEPTDVWYPAWSRFEGKVLALSERAKAKVARATNRGDLPPDLSSMSRAAEPIASLDEYGKVIWDKKIKERLQALAKISQQ